MRNHDQKNKDMCESVLPSTSRQNARELRRIAHGTNRAAERVALRGIGRIDYEGRLSDADVRRRGAVGEMVRDRRAADKISSLVRWARVTVQHDPKLRNAEREDVLGHFASLLPDNTIGRHAVQHIDYGLFGHSFGHSVSWEEILERRAAAVKAERERFRVKVTALVRAGRHGDINREVRRLREPQLTAVERAKIEGRRCDRLPLLPYLEGVHHLDEWVVAVQDDGAVRAAVERLTASGG